jgi:hypothetical protein
MPLTKIQQLLLIFVLSFICLDVFAQPAHVEVRTNEQGYYRLYVDGQPFYVKGAGGTAHWDEVVAAGGNAVRTWSTDNAKEYLDQAQALGLKVMMGMWMQHERHGFDYDNAAKVKAQLESFRKVVLEIKDHPALLLWGVGNEVDLFYKNTNVWKAVEDVAKMIHELDPHHPTCTVTAGLDPEEVKLIKRDAPSIDIYGINTYGDLGGVRKNLKSFGWTGPYLITEWGPNGHWEVQKTTWNAPLEQTSEEKRLSYETRYKNEILGDPQQCMGSFVFLWGQKQETTSTWYGVFSIDGRKSPAVDVMHEVWTDKKPSNLAPIINTLRVVNQSASPYAIVYAGEKGEAYLEWTEPDQDPCQVIWRWIPESQDIKAGGDAETAPLAMTGVWKSRKHFKSSFRAPMTAGAYRIFVEIWDNHNHYAYANLPVLVNARPSDMKPAHWLDIKQYSDDNWKND